MTAIGCDALAPAVVPQATALPLPTAPLSQRQTTPTPTPPPTQPFPTQTPILHPTTTLDSQIADWTLLIYLDADNNLERAGLLDLQEMETAAASPKVNVVVQMDRAHGNNTDFDSWTTTRRYLVQPDSDPTRIGSQLLDDLGERNMGDPAELANFISWGIQAYPANRTALIIWDHGAGWNGIAFDDNGNSDGTDHITLRELQIALADGLANSPIEKLDVVGFDACLMGQLDVFHALHPFADYAVGSEELTPGLGWDYTALLNRLGADSDMNGARLAQQMVTHYVEYYTHVEPDPFVTMTAVHLISLPYLTTAVTQLAEQSTAAISSVASAVGDARSGAEAFARVYAEEVERYAAIDLRHYAEILAQRSPEPSVQQAARNVVAAVDTVVVAHEAGNGFPNSAGIAVYFPRNIAFYDDAYRLATNLPAWSQFLSHYYAAGFMGLTAPTLQINSVAQETAGVQDPVLLRFEIIGREIENVVVLAARIEEDGRLRLVEYDNLIPEPTLLPDGGQLYEWRDGVHEDFFVWDTEVTYLFDEAGVGEFVVMWPTEYGSSLFTVQGQFRRAATGELFEANLVFDHARGRMTRVWSYESDSRTGVAELFPQPGDSFVLHALYLAEDLSVVREPGPTLTFDEAGMLYFDKRPLPSDTYRFGFEAENVAGDTAYELITLDVNNETLQEGVDTYLDPYLGFRFLHPDVWYRPVYEDTLLYTSARSADQKFQLMLYPELANDVTLDALKQEVLRQFGAVSILFEDETIVDGRLALRTAYGYSDEHGDRTGQFVTVINEGTGFVIDVDGATEIEDETLAAVEQIISSWRFAGEEFLSRPGRWTTLDFDAFSVAQPADFVYSQVNEWQRFSSGQHVFAALRTEPVTQPSVKLLGQLVADAQYGVKNFAAGGVMPYGLNGQVWQRVEFSYLASDDTEIWGYIMVREEADRHVVAWAEAPSAVYNELETAVFLTMISDLETKSN